jgi:hypothetical protein
MLRPYGLVKDLILRSTTASFQSSGGAFGSVPPQVGPNRTELLFKGEVYQEGASAFFSSLAFPVFLQRRLLLFSNFQIF